MSTPQAARFDAVVVGAGPAGSIAALVLARGGARVALADKAAFPRDKACGDLIGPRGVQVLDDLGLTVPDAGHGSDLLAVGPSGRRSRLPAFTGRSYPGHGIVVPRVAFDHALREAALDAGAVGVRARVAAVEQDPDGTVRAVLASDGQRLAGDVIIGADGALSTVARLAGMLDSESALWGFAVRAYVPGEVPLPLLVLLESAPWRIYPGYGWLFPGADGQANVGIGIGMGGTRHSAPLRDDLDRFTALLRSRGDLRPAAEPGPVVGGWLRMGGTGTPPAVANVLLAGDAAGLINPLQGEGIAPAMISARLAAEAVLADPCRAGPAYTRALHQTFGRYMTGASALQRALLRRPWAASASMRLVTAPGVRHLVASTWSIYWNGLADGARPRPAAWAARGVETAAA
ncbi:MAG TPA: geranylgeranyl reductase family protein, partial [Streptosporangiaceae bacterium]|nr:geranylgeranyl reductase family protein [Streptosporangiaceae bacterium]